MLDFKSNSNGIVLVVNPDYINFRCKPCSFFDIYWKRINRLKWLH